MEFNSVIMKNEILLFTIKWTEVENIMLVKLARFRRSKVACYMWMIDPIKIQALSYIHINTTKYVSKSGTVTGD
jgi:hypothetical protein